MYRIHKLEEQIEKDKYIIGKQQQQIEQLTNNWNELEEWLDINDRYSQGYFKEVLGKMKEIKEGNNVKN